MNCPHGINLKHRSCDRCEEVAYAERRDNRGPKSDRVACDYVDDKALSKTPEKPMSRDFIHILENPMAGDVIEVREKHHEPELDGDETYEYESMLRVVAVHEERVWFKEYGMKGHQIITVKQWRKRLAGVLVGTVIRPADHDCPY